MSECFSGQALTVIVYENEKSQYDDLLRYYKMIFSPLGYQCNFIWRTRRTEIANDLKKHPHVVICDVEFGNDFPHEGLETIAEYRIKYPHVIFVACSRQPIKIKQFGINYPNADVVMSKVEIRTSPGYREYLSSVFREKIQRNLIDDVEYVGGFDSAMSSFIGTKPKPDDIKALVSLVTFVSHGQQADTSIQKVVLRSLSGGYSGSSVFEMRVCVQGRSLGVPGVLKVSRAENARVELENYNRFVKWFLPYTWRVDVMGEGFIGDFGAVCYSFVLGGGGSPETVSHFIKEGIFEPVSDVVKTIFSESSQSWYSYIPLISDMDISSYYSQAPFFRKPQRINEANSQFKNFARQFSRIGNVSFEEREGHIVVGDEKYRSPEDLLFSQDWGKFARCICHGDLNTNNIMYEPTKKAIAFIDFQRTGYAHAFVDFISFESSIRLDAPGDMSGKNSTILDFINMELDAFNAEWEMVEEIPEQYMSHILAVRQAAHRNFPDEPYQNYVYGSTVHHWTLMSKIKWPELKMLRILGVILAGLNWLERNKVARESK